MKKIMILYQNKYVLQKAKELGYSIVLVSESNTPKNLEYADYFRCIPYSDLDACINFAKEMKIDGVLAATDVTVIPASYIASKLNLPSISFETAKLIKNKYDWQKVLESNNINNLPQSFLIENIEQLNKIKSEIHFPVIIKPNDGAGSVGVSKASNIKELVKNCTSAIGLSKSKKVLIETYISGNEYSVEAFVYNNIISILGITHKIMNTPPSHTTLWHIIPSGLNTHLETLLKAMVFKVIGLLGITSRFC